MYTASEKFLIEYASQPLSKPTPVKMLCKVGRSSHIAAFSIVFPVQCNFPLSFESSPLLPVRFSSGHRPSCAHTASAARFPSTVFLFVYGGVGKPHSSFSRTLHKEKEESLVRNPGEGAAQAGGFTGVL